MSGSTILIVMLVAIGAAALGWWAYRRAQTPTDSAEADAGRKHPEQWGVRIEAPDERRACPQVRALLGKEFPLAQKPPLPVADCPLSSQCECRYVKLFDRRAESRRAAHSRRQGGERFEKDKVPRRSGRDRRGKKVDWF